ncbi:MAG: class I SAM-dependent methyltransferase [Chlamydiota bacterium]
MQALRNYALIDSGDRQKIEDFGGHHIIRPCSQAIWKKNLDNQLWENAQAIFSREGKNFWQKKELPHEWQVKIDKIIFKISPTDFGHLGVFPEQRKLWRWIGDTVKKSSRKLKILNLFAYSGGSTLAAAMEGAHVTHLDASKGMVSWARENAALNNLADAPIRWIVDDVRKFLKRELRRGNCYDGIILDPPSFGRGAKGEMFKIEYEIGSLLNDCCNLLSQDPLFLLLSCHTSGYSPSVLGNLLEQALPTGKVDVGEMTLDGEGRTFDVPSGSFAHWEA